MIIYFVFINILLYVPYMYATYKLRAQMIISIEIF